MLSARAMEKSLPTNGTASRGRGCIHLEQFKGPEEAFARLSAGANSQLPWLLRIFGRNGTVLVARLDGVLAGFCSFGSARDEGVDRLRIGELYALFVEPIAYRRGVGSELCAKSLDRLKEQGFDLAIGWVSDVNMHARRFFEAMGFEEGGEVVTSVTNEQSLTIVKYTFSLHS